MGRLYLVWRTRPHGRSTGPDGNYETIRGGLSKFDGRLELVARSCPTALNLLLCTLRIRKHHCTRDGDVYAFSHRHTRRGSPAVFSRALARVLLKSRRLTDSLRHNASTDILRRRLHIATNLVDPGPDYVSDNDQRLEFSRIYLVENSKTLVTTTWLDIPEHLCPRNSESKKDHESYSSMRQKISNPNSANYPTTSNS